jgi:hypothetical protein
MPATIQRGQGLENAIDRMTPLFIDKSRLDNPPKVRKKFNGVQPKLFAKLSMPN